MAVFTSHGARRGIGALLLGTAFAVPVRAEEPVVLAPIVIWGAQEDANGSGPVPGVVAKMTGTAAKSATPLAETPQSVSVVGRKEMAERGATTVTEALRYTPGVLTSARPATRYDLGGIRGFGTQGGQSWFDYLDGTRMLRGGYNAPVMDAWNIERIEVLRGPASVLYGGGMPGGIVNQVTKRPRDEAAREVEFRLADPKGAALAFDVTGPVAGDSRYLYRVVGLASSMDGNVRHTKSERYMLAPSFTWRPTDSTEVTLQAGVIHDPASFYAVYLPSVGTLVKHPAGKKIPYDFNVEDPDFAGFDRTQTWLGYEISHAFSPDVKLTHSLRWMDVDSEQHGMTPLPQAPMAWVTPDGSMLRRTALHVLDESRALTTDTRLEFGFETGAVEHRMLAGLDYQLLDFTRHNSAETLAPPIDYLNPVYGVKLDLPYVRRVDEDRRQTGLYLQDQMAFGPWRVVAGLRHDHYRSTIDTTDLASGLGRRGEVRHSKTTGRIGAVYDMGNGVLPYLSYATSFEPQASSITGVDGSGKPVGFNPTTGQQWELGLRYEPQSFRGMISAALFDIRQRNVAVASGVANPLCSTPMNCQTQAGEVRSRGLELEAKAEVTEDFDLIASYAYTDIETIKSSPAAVLAVGKTPAGVPMHQFGLWGHRTFATGLSMGAGLRYVGSSWGDSANQHRVPDFTLVDLSLGYDFGAQDARLSGLKLNLGISNLFDKEYVASCAAVGTSTVAGLTGYCFQGEGRRITAALNYRW
ncbi:TonB-dependent siderophore receptor [Paenirhodobacter sp.]|uniref:TonB-dependent siderophore receptor n=1 Tax=Paenirhodobacter sp. TaxID=1965326 RepID=UPI003B41E735